MARLIKRVKVVAMYANTSQKTKSAKYTALTGGAYITNILLINRSFSPIFLKNAIDDQLFNKINTYFTIKCQVKRLVVKNCTAFAKQIIV